MAVNLGDGDGVVTTATGSAAAFAATVKANDGIIVTPSTPSSSATVVFTITNPNCTATTIVQAEVMGPNATVGATNTTLGNVINEVTSAAGSFTINLKTAAALNGTMAVGFALN